LDTWICLATTPPPLPTSPIQDQSTAAVFPSCAARHAENMLTPIRVEFEIKTAMMTNTICYHSQCDDIPVEHKWDRSVGPTECFF
jgi:hypothetical protein